VAAQDITVAAYDDTVAAYDDTVAAHDDTVAAQDITVAAQETLVDPVRALRSEEDYGEVGGVTVMCARIGRPNRMLSCASSKILPIGMRLGWGSTNGPVAVCTATKT